MQQYVFTEADSSGGRTQPKIDKLIITSPYKEPAEHWGYDRNTETFARVHGRREAGYLIATKGDKGPDDPGQRRTIPLVGEISKRIRRWREDGYIGVTRVTKRLLEYWQDENARAGKPFFFCQLEAAETHWGVTMSLRTAGAGGAYGGRAILLTTSHRNGTVVQTDAVTRHRATSRLAGGAWWIWARGRGSCRLPKSRGDGRDSPRPQLFGRDPDC